MRQLNEGKNNRTTFVAAIVRRHITYSFAISFGTSIDREEKRMRRKKREKKYTEEDEEKEQDSERPVGSWNASARNKISIPRALIEPGYVFPCGIGRERCLPLPISRSLDFKPAQKWKEEDGESDGERGGGGELNLHARLVIWHRHGILRVRRWGKVEERSAVR